MNIFLAIAHELSWIFTLLTAMVGIRFLRQFTKAMITSMEKLTQALSHEVHRLNRHEQRLDFYDRVFSDHEVRIKMMEGNRDEFTSI